ncbi:cysteine-rich repeat secretory protein 38-like [Cornus florida]|uniref:cysteine-rich repeat secretory protein 38-like n=1 Tax=Cornus florida TaxID=4283 RepID=UPI00289B7E4C|nr:cysteine-rich repeat secretory protein 38-like [Cornus florida]
MYFSKSFPPPVFLISFFLLLHTVLCGNPLYHFCFSQDTYTANSPYNSNLNELRNLVRTKVPPTGFGFGWVGQGQNRVNGLALCWGDVSKSNCKTCVTEATKVIRERCPRKKGAIIWYDNCLFKYSNVVFFGKIDNTNKAYLYSVHKVADPKTFNQKTKKLLSSLASKASGSPVLYAAGKLELEGSKKLYGLVRCTQDLSKIDCKKCLDGAISELPRCCDGKQGGRVLGGSCSFRYELYPFELRKKVSGNIGDEQAESLFVKGKSGTKGSGSRGKSRSHKNMEYYYCHEIGRIIEHCPKLRQRMGMAKRRFKKQLLCRDSFSSYKEVKCGSILTADRKDFKILGIGTVKIKTYNGLVRTLSDVRHVPDLKMNLISARHQGENFISSPGEYSNRWSYYRIFYSSQKSAFRSWQKKSYDSSSQKGCERTTQRGGRMKSIFRWQPKL